MRSVLTIGLALLFLTGCSSLKFWDRDSGEDVTGPAKLSSFDEEVRFRRVWSTSVGSGLDEHHPTLNPALLGGVVYAAGSKGDIAAIDAESGERLWRARLKKRSLTGGVGVGGDLVLVGTVGGRVYALDRATGETRWDRQLSSEILDAPAANRQIVVVRTANGYLHGLDPETGEQRWQMDYEKPLLTLRRESNPVIVGSTLLAGFSNGRLRAFNAVDGVTQWEVRLAIPQGRNELERMVDVATPVVVSDVVYAAGYQGRVSAVSRGTGRTLWMQDSSTFFKPAVGGNQVYVVETDDRIRALRASSGAELWSNHDLRYRRLTSPVTLDRWLILADGEGYIHALDQSNGEYAGRTRARRGGVSTHLLADGQRFYVMSNNGRVAAYEQR